MSAVTIAQLGLVEPRVRPADGDDLIIERDAAGCAVAERVKQDAMADDTAVAQHDIPAPSRTTTGCPGLDRADHA
jgi:hypothetical protein